VINTTNTVTTLATLEEKAASAARVSSATNELAKLLCSYHIGTEGAAESDKPFKYLMGGKGIYKVVNNKVGEFIIKLPTTDTIPGLPDLAEGVSLKLPKIPYSEFYRTIAFFKEVISKKGNYEAMLQFYYDEANKSYIVFCPDQEITGTTVKFKRHPEMDDNYTIVMDIHSHNSMGAFFSGVDNADEKETRLFGVIGELNREYPAFKFRISVSGVYKEISYLSVFDFPLEDMMARISASIPAAADSPSDMLKYLNGLILHDIANQDITIPEEWMEKCKKPTTPTHGNVTYFYGNRANYGDGDFNLYRNGAYSTTGVVPFERTRRPRSRRSGGTSSIEVDAGHYSPAADVNNYEYDTEESWVNRREKNLLDNLTTQELYQELYADLRHITTRNIEEEITDNERDIADLLPDVYSLSTIDALDLAIDLLAAHPEMVFQAILDNKSLEEFHTYVYANYAQV